MLKATNYGIIEGAKDLQGILKFEPERPTKRTEFLKMAMEAAGVNHDVSTDYWKNIIAPYKTASEDEIALTGEEGPATNIYNEVKKLEWAQKYIEYSNIKQILHYGNTSDNILKYNEYITREEAAHVVKSIHVDNTSQFNMSASLGNYAVEVVYNFTFDNTAGTKNRKVNYWMFTGSNIVCWSERTGYMLKAGYNIRTVDKIHEFDVPAGQVSTYKFKFVMPTADAGGMWSFLEVETAE